MLPNCLKLVSGSVSLPVIGKKFTWIFLFWLSLWVQCFKFTAKSISKNCCLLSCLSLQHGRTHFHHRLSSLNKFLCLFHSKTLSLCPSSEKSCECPCSWMAEIKHCLAWRYYKSNLNTCHIKNEMAIIFTSLNGFYNGVFCSGMSHSNFIVHDLIPGLSRTQPTSLTFWFHPSSETILKCWLLDQTVVTTG